MTGVTPAWAPAAIIADLSESHSSAGDEPIKHGTGQENKVTPPPADWLVALSADSQGPQRLNHLTESNNRVILCKNHSKARSLY